MQSFWMAFSISVNKISAKGWICSVFQMERDTVIDLDIRLPFYWKKDWLSLYLNWQKIPIRNFLYLAQMQAAAILGVVGWPLAESSLSPLFFNNRYMPLKKRTSFRSIHL